MSGEEEIWCGRGTRTPKPFGSCGRTTPALVVLRSRIVLFAAEGLQNKQIAVTLNVAPRMAVLTQNRSFRPN